MAAVIALAGCSMGEDLGISDKAVADFHQKVDAGQVDAIVDAAAPEAKGDVAQFHTLLDAVHRRLGAFKSSSRTGFNDNYENGLHTITTSYASVFANGTAQETFVYKLVDGKPQLLSYNIQSSVK
jgi:hypothetical protein